MRLRARRRILYDIYILILYIYTSRGVEKGEGRYSNMATIADARALLLLSSFYLAKSERREISSKPRSRLRDTYRHRRSVREKSRELDERDKLQCTGEKSRDSGSVDGCPGRTRGCLSRCLRA